MVRAALEFRFPKIGDYANGGVELELRHALEPWHVMGEEGAAGGAVRYVDSSVERLQVKVDRTRAGSLCAHLQWPRDSVATDGPDRRIRRRRALSRVAAAISVAPDDRLTRAADVRSRRYLAEALDSAVASITSLIPEVSATPSFPVNAFEAESRRLTRFFRTGHTAGKVEAPPADKAPEFSFTVDLRRT